MSKTDFEIRFALLATNEKIPDRFLTTGKNDQLHDNFLFHLIEINSSSNLAAKIKKTLTSILEHEYVRGIFSEEDFEKVIEKINLSLQKIFEQDNTELHNKINAIISFVKENQIFIAQSGKISGYIFRKSKISSLTENSSINADSNPFCMFNDIISGSLTGEDRIIFGNNELYNHISLDRIRRTSENLHAREAIYEIAKNLKKIRVRDVNAILLEASKPGTNTDQKLPEIIFLDEPEENLFSIIKKKSTPIVKASSKKIASESLYAFSLLSKQLKSLYQNLKKNWQKTISPKAKEILALSGSKTIEIMSDAKKNISPKISKLKEIESLKKIKIKTNNYSSNNKSNAYHFFSATLLYLSALKSFFSKKDSRKYLYAILIIFFLLLGYGKIHSNNVKKDAVKEEQETALSYDKAKAIFNQAKEDVALGKNNGENKYKEALDAAQKAEKYPPTKDKSIALIHEIQAELDKSIKMSRYYPDQLPVTKLESNVEKITYVGNEVYGFDENGKIYEAIPTDKEARLIASIGTDKGKPLSISYSSQNDQIFIYTSNNSVLDFDIKAKSTSNLTADGGWTNAVSIASFSSNLYLLNSQEGTIVKYTSNEENYNKGTIYVDNKKGNLKNSFDLGIDGNLYALLSDGNISKFSRGTKDNEFAISGIPLPDNTIGKPGKICLTAESSYIYALDTQKNRILRFDKNGAFLSQYTLDSSIISDFSVNDKIKKMWISSGNSIYEIDLQ